MSTGDPICRRCGICLSLVKDCWHTDCPVSRTALGKRLSDDPGLAEMNRMEYLMSKAPCIKNHANPPMRIEGFPDVNALADWSEKKD